MLHSTSMDQNAASYLFELSYLVVTVGILYFFLVRADTKEFSQKKLYKHWILFGFVINLYGLSWLYTAYPLPWLQEGALQYLGIGLLHILLSSAVAIPYAVIAYAYNKKISASISPCIFAITLTIAEACRSLILSLMYKGKGTTIAYHFTAGTLGNALSPTPLIEFAYFGGTFALTFILGYILYSVYTKSNFIHYWKHIMTILVVLVLVHFFVPVHMPQEKIDVGVVTTNFTLPEKKEDIANAFKAQQKILHTMTLSLASSSPKIIVYPEDTRYISHLMPTERTDLLVHFNHTVFVDGDTIKTQGKLSNVSLFYVPKTGKKLVRGKEFLLPFSEYVPFMFSPLLRLFVGKSNLSSYAEEHTYIPIHSSKTIIASGERIGTLLCSEIFSYTTLEKMKREDPSIIFFQSRMDVFHNNPWFIMHLRSFTKVAAAQLRTTIVSSTSNAPSLIVSPYGRVLHFIPTSLSASIYSIE